MGEELLSEGAQASFTRLAVLNLVVELLLQIKNIDCGRWLRGDVTHEQIAALRGLSRRQDRVEVVLVTFLLVLLRLVHLAERGLLLTLGFFVGDGGGNEHGLIVLHEGVVHI